MINRPRTRTLTFRVTDDELALLQNAANSIGKRCLSDFVRDSALHAVVVGTDNRNSPDHSNLAVADQLDAVIGRVNELEDRFADLMKLFGERRPRLREVPK